MLRVAVRPVGDECHCAGFQSYFLPFDFDVLFGDLVLLFEFQVS